MNLTIRLRIMDFSTVRCVGKPLAHKRDVHSLMPLWWGGVVYMMGLPLPDVLV